MDLSTFKSEQKKLSEVVQRHGKQALADEFKAFFERHPNVDAVRWTQYTPHFNDGDPCTFDRHEFECRGEFTDALIVAKQMDDDGFYASWDAEKGGEYDKILDELSETFSDTNDVFRVAFGDGVQVTATRKGFTVNDYDHD